MPTFFSGDLSLISIVSVGLLSAVFNSGSGAGVFGVRVGLVILDFLVTLTTRLIVVVVGGLDSIGDDESLLLAIIDFSSDTLQRLGICLVVGSFSGEQDKILLISFGGVSFEAG